MAKLAGKDELAWNASVTQVRPALAANTSSETLARAV